MRIELSLQDLIRVGLATSVDPLGELTSSLQLLQRRDGGTPGGSAFARWRHRVWQGLPESASVLMWLCRPDEPVPEFLAPMAGRTELEPGLAAVLSTEPASLKAGLCHAAADRDLPAWAAGLACGDTTGLPKLVQTLRDYFELALAPGWDTVRAQVDADRAMRTQLVLRGGVDALLTSLRPLVRWVAPILELDDRSAGDRSAGGAGLLLVPTYFSVCPALIPGPGSGGAAWLRYPVVRQLAQAVHTGRGALRPRSPGGALSCLLGPTRAAALMILADGCGTSELAARLGVTPSAASKHTSVLRQAGLIITHRDRNTVLHALTPLGSALLDKDS